MSIRSILATFLFTVVLNVYYSQDSVFHYQNSIGRELDIVCYVSNDSVLYTYVLMEVNNDRIEDYENVISYHLFLEKNELEGKLAETQSSNYLVRKNEDFFIMEFVNPIDYIRVNPSNNSEKVIIFRSVSFMPKEKILHGSSIFYLKN